MGKSAMEYKCDLKAATVVWWRFFWRYALVFVAIILLMGFSVNFLGNLQPHCLYRITLLAGVFANIIATMSGLFYCLDRKFKESPIVLTGKKENTGIVNRLWICFLYFLRFSLLAIAIAVFLGYMLPLCFKCVGAEPAKALKYSKYLGDVSLIPASYLAFISLVCRKEKRQTLRIAVSE